MKRVNKQSEIDEKIHSEIKKLYYKVPSEIQTEDALSSFEVLSRKASSYELYLHKSEYIHLFTRTIWGLQQSDEKTVGRVIKLTDWFIAQRGRADSLYKGRLKGLVRLMKDKKMPVPPEKYQDWDAQLEPKHPRTCIQPVLMDPDIVYTDFLDKRTHRKPRSIDM